MMTVTSKWPRLFAVALAGAATIMALPSAAARARAATAPPVAFILLDGNQSLTGAGFAAERQAALAYARALPADVPAGLIAFADRWRVALAPTTDRARMGAAIQAIRVGGATSNGLVAALAGAGSQLRSVGAGPGSRLLVLSDAEEFTASSLTASVPVDVILRYYERDDHLAPLRALALSTGGRIATPGEAAALAEAVSSAGPAPVATPGRGAALGLLAGVLGAVFLALFAMAWLMISSVVGGDRRRQLVAQIERYGPRRMPPSAAADGALARSAIDVTSALLQRSNAGQTLATRLDLAGIARQPAEWALLAVAVCAGLSAALTLLFGNVLLGTLLGVAVGWIGLRLYVSMRISRRRAAFGAQLPDVLQFIAGSLRSGFSLAQALDAAVREDSQPASGEFRRALAEARVGVDLDAALSGVAERMQSVDLQWTVMAIRIQREVGGNLAEILTNTIATMRERAYLRRHVRTLSAEGRLSAYILIALPLLMAAWLLFTDGSYLRLLYTTVIGIAMLTGSLALFVVGVFWIRAVIKVEV